MTRICVRAIVLHEGKLLAVRLNHYEGAIKLPQDFWCLPGGGVDEGEALTDALHREMLEETGIAPQLGNLLYVHQFSDAGMNFVEFFFHVTNGQDYLQIDLSKTTHGEHEIAEQGFVDPATTSLLPKFLSTADLVAKATDQSPTEIVAYR